MHTEYPMTAAFKPACGVPLNRWTIGLMMAGLVSLAAVATAEETQHQVLTALSSTTLSGYVDTSAIWMFGTGNTLYGRSFDQGSNAALSGLNKQDGFNLNAVNLTLEKPLTEGGWSAGYRAELMFGPDANALASSSLSTTRLILRSKKPMWLSEHQLAMDWTSSWASGLSCWVTK
jgi:hypothetical protein